MYPKVCVTNQLTASQAKFTLRNKARNKKGLQQCSPFLLFAHTIVMVFLQRAVFYCMHGGKFINKALMTLCKYIGGVFINARIANLEE